MKFTPLFTGDIPEVKTEQDAREWIKALGDSSYAFHLEDDPRGIFLFKDSPKNELSDKRAFTDKQCEHLDFCVAACFDLIDPWPIFMDGIQKKLGLGRHAPKPYGEVPEEKAD